MAASLNKFVRKALKKIAGFIFARYFFTKVFIGLVAGTIVAAIFLNNGFEKFELVALDQRFRLRPERPTDKNIAIIEMGDDSIEAIGRWPWPREWHATLLSILKRYHARLVIFDVIFDDESTPSQDAVFREAIRSAGNVYLPFVFQFQEGDMPIKDRPALPRGRAKSGRPSGNVRNIIYPLQKFLDVSRGSGHVNVVPDRDGIVRRTPLVIAYRNTFYPQIACKAVADYLGAQDRDIIVKPGRYIVLKNTALGDIKIPVDPDNEMLVSWAGPWRETFKHYSYIDIIVSYRNILNNEKPRIDLDELKGKVCIVGLTATGLYDIRPTSLEPSYPVVGINANIMNNILKGDFIRQVPKAVDIFFIYLMGILVTLVVSTVRFIRGAVYTALIIFGYIMISFLAFAVLGRWVAAVYPAVAMAASFLGVTLYNEIVIALKGKKYFDLSIRDGLTKLFNISHFNEILEREFDISSGKRKTRKLCLIMADVDHFKDFNDRYGHQAGDLVLKMVARMFKERTRGHDVAARYGGEEFIMMLPGTDREDAGHIAERIRNRIEHTPLQRHNKTYRVTVSLGVAMLEGEKTKAELIKKVDEALYAAKKSGRNRVCFK